MLYEVITDTVEEHRHFRAECDTQILVERRVKPRVGVERLEPADTEPLESEIRHEWLRALVSEHAANLSGIDLWIAELATLDERQQLVVRPLTPEEERKPPGVV